jgi:DNA-binding transcriptional regulator/RsmH inhibitor MraZ
MPRREQKLGNHPFGTWTVTVDDLHRVRLSREIADIVDWIDLNKPAIECVGILGPEGGIQLLPRPAHEGAVTQVSDAVAGNAPTATESAQSWVEVARFLGTAWPMSLSIEAGRISFTIPEPARRSQQFPLPGGAVVVFAFGDIFEIWEATKWHDHVRKTARKYPSALLQALEDLRQR